jgi:hypothetical protein
MASLIMILFFYSLSAHAQNVRGELHISARDPHGAALTATAVLVSGTNQFRRTFALGPDGQYVLHNLTFGIYRLTLQANGFAIWTTLLNVRSEVPVYILATFVLPSVSTQVEVNGSATLVDPYGIGTVYSIGQMAIAEHIATQPGRDLPDLVNEEPGWLYEANGVLHPRGSEYDVQYVVDGIPITQNRSPAFAPAFDSEKVESMRVLTAGYPAEYGRKLGGVVEVTSEKNLPAGLHGQFNAIGGSFNTTEISAGIFYKTGKNNFAFTGDGFHTDRYLDPPVLANFTNRGNTDGFSASYERDFSDSDRLHLSVVHNTVRFQVPNELIQQNAGQRQDRTDTETDGQIDFQHAFSPNLFLTAAASVRDAEATLSSNQLATPVIVSQNRGYREGYIRGDLAGHHGFNDWKVGVDTLLGPAYEQLQYTITDPTQFDLGTRQRFQFSDHRWDIEPSAYLQDQMHLGKWNISAGMRFDRYHFVVLESAWSPRLGVSRYFSSLNLLIHASYDRIFQTPAVENLLLASSAQLDVVDPTVVRLPVQPAHADFYEVGLLKSVFGKLRLDANIFRRDFRNYSDDDVLLDTGASFPIAFRRARISGEEIRIEIPIWHLFSGYLSYSNQTGVGEGPITGGLFLGSDAADALADTRRFPVSQDQRNTARVRLRVQPFSRLWFAFGEQYGSGLPAEGTSDNADFLLAQFGPDILRHINFARGRVRPNFSLDGVIGAELLHHERRSVEAELQSNNLTDRINVINFASLFSGTAIAPQRSISARLKFTF